MEMLKARPGGERKMEGFRRGLCRIKERISPSVSV